MRRSVPNWLIRSGWRAPFGFSNRSAGPPALTVAVDDLRDLEVGIDLGGDANELAFALEEPNPLAQIGGRSHRASVYGVGVRNCLGERERVPPLEVVARDACESGRERLPLLLPRTEPPAPLLRLDGAPENRGAVGIAELV